MLGPKVLIADPDEPLLMKSMNEFEVSAYYVKPLSAQDLGRCLRRLLNAESVGPNL